MMMKYLCLSILLVCCFAKAEEANQSIEQTFTLYPPDDSVTHKYDEIRACFSFKRGAIRTSMQEDWDLGYSFLKISDQDYLQVSAGNEQRSVMKDLGKHTWADSFKVPFLRPLPEVEEGQQRVIGVDSSADTHKQWAATNGIFAKAVAGHIYAAHIKTSSADFYVLFRIEELEQGKECTISWKVVAEPEEK
jgi:hypothetical protein